MVWISKDLKTQFNFTFDQTFYYMRSRPHRLDTSNEDRPKDRERFLSVGESYDDSFSHSYRDRNRSRHMNRRRDNESPLSSVSKSNSSNGRYRMSRSKRHKSTDEDDLTRPWITGRMKEAPECMRIFEFIHGVNIPELTKRLNEHVPKTMEEMMITTTAFIRGEAAAASKKKGHASWKAQDQSKRQNSNKSNKFCDFHNDKGHSTDECMQLKKKIEELVRAGKLSHLIKEIKHERDQSKMGKKETTAKDKPMKIYMIQSWQRTTRQKVTQSFERVKEITFPPLAASSATEGPLVIEAEMSEHMIHHMYVDDGSSMEILYEHCFNRLRPEIKSQMVPATTSLTGFSDETIWPLGQLKLLEVAIRGMLSDKGRTELCSILKKNLDIFSWQPSDMTGVLRSVAEHRLNIREGYSPVRQKKRGHAPERAKAIQAEVQKLVKVGIMREVYYHDWLSNPVMVKKHDGSWRMCVDFMDLNKACPQNCYPLLEIDWKVESLCGYPFKSFLDAYKGYHQIQLYCLLDAYKGYHQIQLAEPDEEKTAFHTGQGVYCYVKIPFGLKNAGATYQRLMDKAFKSQIGRNIEVYVDELVVKSYTKAEMLRDNEETFRTLRKINMKLNPKKCAFGLAEGVFLGYVFTPYGIKPCPDKIVDVLQLPSPRTIKEVQSLNGKLASLNRFLSKSAKKSLPLFKILKKCIKKSDFHWTAEAEQAFKQLKQHLSELPLLVAPKPKEELIIYLFATYGAISAVL
nr:reverse transcriptase domain-containing protein [Tanacetum cinerariifolium]